MNWSIDTVAECSELLLIAELWQAVNDKKWRVDTSQSYIVVEGEYVQLMERPTNQQFSVGQTEHQSCVMEQPGQPINRQRHSKVSKETRENLRDQNIMAVPWNNEVFDSISRNLDSYEKQGINMIAAIKWIIGQFRYQN